MEENDSLEIIEADNYKSGKDQMFSHQVLVMKGMSKCIEAGTKEMRPGFYNEKFDKSGNKVLVYNPDTRKEFIECVKTVLMIMICDLDKIAIENIKKIKEKLSDEYKELCKREKIDWEASSITNKRSRWSRGIFYQDQTLNTKLPYYQEYIEFEVDCYRDIFAELTQQTKRIDFYEAEDYEA